MLHNNEGRFAKVFFSFFAIFPSEQQSKRAHTFALKNMTLFWFLILFASLLLLLWFLFWSDLILQWSDPLNCPSEYFAKYKASSEVLRRAQETTETQEKYLVVGAGFTGLAVMAALKRNGIAFDGVEKNDQIGT